MGCRARPTGHLRASPIAYAADPASTGTASSPVPTIPSAKIVSASEPAIGRNASAACAEVAMSVTPLTFSVAAVVIMIASAIRLGDAHAGQRVELDAVEGRLPLLGRALQDFSARDRAYVLSFLAGLPEEQVGADRRPEYCDDGCEDVLAPRHFRNNEAGQGLAPGHLH